MNNKLYKVRKAMREGTFWKKVNGYVIDNNKIARTLYYKHKYPNSWQFIVKKRQKAMRRYGYKYLGLVFDAFEKYNSKVFVTFGTLLGFIRNGKFIEYDSDIDLGVYLDNELSWEKIEFEMQTIGFELYRQFRHDGVVTEQTYVRNNLTIDFFSYHENEYNQSVCYCYYKMKNKEYSNKDEYSIIELRMSPIEGTMEMFIKNRRYIVPSNAEEYLASVYTTNWRYPDPNWVSENGPAWNELKDKYGHIEVFKQF